MLRYCRCKLNVKATTSNIMVYGECGMFPPSVQCTISTMCYMNRLYHMPGGIIAKRVYEELNKLHSMGFTTWVTRVNEVIINHGMDITKLPSNFRIECKNVVITQFKTQWNRDMQNIETYPILRTYNKFKDLFVIEPYLYMLKNHKYRVAVVQLRTNSHTLAIERGRYSRPKVQICDRTCNVCGIWEDETHFLIHYSLYKREREVLFSKWENSLINHSKLGLKNCYKQRGNLITTPKAFYCYDILCVVYTHLYMYVLTSKSLQNPKILDNIKFYVMEYTFMFQWFNRYVLPHFIDWQAGVVVAAALSLLVASGSAVMTASGATGSDGVVSMTTVFQYHWMHVRFTYVLNVYFIIYWVRNDLIKMIKQFRTKVFALQEMLR